MIDFFKSIFTDSRFLTAVKGFVVVVFGIILENLLKVIDNVGTPAVDALSNVTP